MNQPIALTYPAGQPAVARLVAGSLWTLFAGTLLTLLSSAGGVNTACALTLTWGASACSLDLAALVGIPLLAWGAYRLREAVEIDGYYDTALGVVLGVAVLAVVPAARGAIPVPLGPVMTGWPVVVGLLLPVTWLLLCMAMRRLCLHLGLDRLAGLWRVVLIVWVPLFTVPQILWHAGRLSSLLGGDPWAGLPEVVAIPTIILMVGGWLASSVFLLVTLGRTAKAAGRMAALATEEQYREQRMASPEAPAPEPVGPPEP